MQTRVTSYFARMIDDGLCTLEDLPTEYQKPVSDYMISPPVRVTNVISDTVEPEIIGALHLDDVENVVNVDEFKSNGFVWAPFKTNTIFKDCVNGNNPMPIDVGYQIILCESEYAPFGNNPDVVLFTTDYGFELKIHGDLDSAPSGTTLLRVDILVKSKNYENMRLTAYIKAK